VIFLAVFTGSLIGSFFGSMAVFWVIGIMAQRTEKKQQAELEELQKSYLDMVQREQTRMEAYAKLES